jgi:MFS family permease
MATIENAPGLPTTRTAGTSAFVTGTFPRRPWLVIGLASLAGFLLTIAWSASFVDSVIGDSVANTLLGHNAKATPIAGIGAGIVFAFVSGLAGTFTACNIAAFSAVGPMLGENAQQQTRVQRLAQILRPLGWLAAGMVAVSAVYGVIVAMVGTRMPQFQQVKLVPGHMPAVLTQSAIVFGAIGLCMIYLGLAAAGIVPDPFARIAQRLPNAPLVFMGVLIGGFLIGRPFPLFRKMFHDAAESGNVLYGAGAFVLQSLGNVVIMAVIFLLLAYATGGRLQRWVAARPSRIATITTASFLVAGVFTVLYWDVRLLSVVKIIPWYPLAPWV